LPAKASVGHVVQERLITEGITPVFALMRHESSCNWYCCQYRSWQWH